MERPAAVPAASFGADREDAIACPVPPSETPAATVSATSRCAADGCSFLGSSGTRSIDPLAGLLKLFVRLRPCSKTPGYLRCVAAARPGEPGLPRCRSIVCPACHRARQAAHERTLARFLRLAASAGLGLRFVTITVAHDAGAALVSCAAAMTSAWAKARQGAPYRRLRLRDGLLGVVNLVHVTYGDNGWHVHEHCVVVAMNLAGAASAALVLCERYARALERAGWRVSATTTHSQEIDAPEGLAGYLFRSWVRSDGGLFALRERAARGCVRAAALFFEAADFLARRKGYVISRRLRDAVGGDRA